MRTQYNNYTKLHASCTDPQRHTGRGGAGRSYATVVGGSTVTPTAIPTAVAVTGRAAKVQMQVDLRRPEHSSFRRASIAAHFMDYLLYLVINVSQTRHATT